MKKIIALFMSCVLCIGLCSCMGGVSERDTKTYEANIYFSNSEFNNLKAEKRTIVYNKGESLAKIVMDTLMEGPLETSSRAVIPENTSVLDFEIVDMIAKINFSSEYLNFSGDNAKSAELLARYSVVKTLCELPVIDQVEIRVDNNMLIGANGEPVGVLGENDIVLSETETSQKYVTLYFSDEMGEKLVATRRRANLVDNSVEKTIITELISGPDANSDCYGTLPAGTKVLSVENKEKICFVNFSKEFAENIGGGSSASTMAIYSVVNSLTELDEVEQVQFLIEGEKTEWLGEYDVSEPFRRDASYIK